jgi:dimethylamine/trimethylamine dehydrogenase
LTCAYRGAHREVACGTLVVVTGRLPQDQLYRELAGLPGLVRVGDCHAPSSIADAVYSAHRYARLLGEVDAPPRRERPPHRSLS